MPRSRAIFERCFSLAGETLRGSRAYFDLDYHAVRDEGAFPEDVLAARLHREAQSLEVRCVHHYCRMCWISSRSWPSVLEICRAYL